MNTPLLDRYRRWLDYERDCNLRVLSSLHDIPTVQHSTAAFEQAVSLLGHLAAARQFWLFRLGVSQRKPATFFPRGLSLAAVEGQLVQAHDDWADYLAGLANEDLDARLSYRSTEGQSFENTVEDILTQLFGHAWYHRGQVAALVRGLGGEPAVTDYVFWTREPVSG
jgi:uncharacterized damage-inducible protein DinB